MKLLLFDTSVWIDYLNGQENFFTTLLDNQLSDRFSVAICPVIIQEILQGIRDEKQFNMVREDLLDLNVLNLDIVEASISAASIYRKLRSKGITVRKPADCLISAYAIYYNIPLVHNDEDFNVIQKQTRLKIFRNS